MASRDRGGPPGNLPGLSRRPVSHNDDYVAERTKETERGILSSERWAPAGAWAPGASRDPPSKVLHVLRRKERGTGVLSRWLAQWLPMTIPPRGGHDIARPSSRLAERDRFANRGGPWEDGCM